MSESDQQQEPPGGSGPAELVLGAVGTVLTVALLGFLGYEALLLRDGGPELSAEVTGLERGDGQVVARVRVRNTGGETAEQVQVTGEVTRGGSTVEQASATVSYVPADSRRSAALVFTADPAQGTLEVRVEGYALP